VSNSAEDVHEKIFHCDGRAGIGGGVVGDSGARWTGLVSEAVQSTAIDNELPIGAGLVHFLDERSDIRHGDMEVQRTMAYENFCFYRAGVRRMGAGQTAVNADNAGQIGASAGSSRTVMPPKQ
jgi:hypothetical protein